MKTIFERKGLATRYGEKHKIKKIKVNEELDLKVQKNALSIDEMQKAFKNSKLITYYEPEMEKNNENNDEKIEEIKKEAGNEEKKGEETSK